MSGPDQAVESYPDWLPVTVEGREKWAIGWIGAVRSPPGLPKCKSCSECLSVFEHRTDSQTVFFRNGEPSAYP